jgi:hypothetical protein
VFFRLSRMGGGVRRWEEEGGDGEKRVRELGRREQIVGKGSDPDSNSDLDSGL